jgi:hypothetical protein
MPFVCAMVAGAFMLPAPSHSQSYSPLPRQSLDTLSGELRGTVSNTGKPYLVTSDISVPVGETVNLEPGVVLLFSEFTGLQVHGTLLASGTRDQPVVFTSQNDQRYVSGDSLQAAPYDWNGVVVHEDAVGTTFRNCSVEFSLYGLKSLTPYLVLDSCVFSHNAKGSFSIRSVEQSVSSGPYSYSAVRPAAAPQNPGALPNLQPQRRTIASYRKPILLSSGSVGAVGGIALIVWKTLDYGSASSNFRALNDENHANLTNPSIVSDWDNAKKRKDLDVGVIVLGCALTVLGAVGLTFSF